MEANTSTTNPEGEVQNIEVYTIPARLQRFYNVISAFEKLDGSDVERQQVAIRVF